MAARRSGYCSVCGHATRGTFALHATTRSHRVAVLRAERRRIGNLTGAKTRRQQRDDAWRRGRRVDTGADKTKVRKHRRRRPVDGPGRVVPVRRYWQRRPGKGSTWTEYHKLGGEWYGVRFGSDGRTRGDFWSPGAAVRRRLARWSGGRVLRSDLMTR
jgi:hypothetical protein